MALRGDIPEGFDSDNGDYKYAAELIKDIKDFGGFCIGEEHAIPKAIRKAVHMKNDIKYLKEK